VSYQEDTDGDSSEPTAAQPFPDLNPSKPLPIIIRASNGKSKEKRDKKVKLSTVVEVDALEAFYGKYAEVCKLGMSGLKKRDRSKAKEKLKAKKKKQGGVVGAVEIKKEKA
jgi:signal recognition particle subunit SRP14